MNTGFFQQNPQDRNSLKSRRRIVLVIGFVLVLLAVAAPIPCLDLTASDNPAPAVFMESLSVEERQWLSDHPVIRVVQDPGWAPIEFADSRGKPSGMSADYLELIEQRLGVTFQLVWGLSWQEAYARLSRWEIDMTTSVAATPERSAFWEFTKPYMEIPIVIITQDDVAYIGNMKELSGRQVAVVDGYAVCDWIPRDFPDIQLVKVKDTQEGLRVLQRGEVFAFIENMLVVGHHLTELNLSTTLKIAGDTPYINAQSMAVRKDWAIFAGILDKALGMISESERDEIYRRWLPVRYERGFDYVRFWQVVTGFTVILVGLAIWIWLLTTEVSRRKKAENALRYSERRFRQLFEIAPMPLALLNRDGALLEVNNQWHQTFGYSLQDIPTIEDWYRLAHPDPTYRQQVVERYEESFRVAKLDTIGFIPPHDYQVTCKNGQVRSVEIAGTLLGDEILAGFFDITERKAAEIEHRQLLHQAEQTRRAILSALEDQQLMQESLRASNATLDAALNNMSDAVFISDAQGRFIHFNHAFVTYHRFANKDECLKTMAEYPGLFEVSFPDGTPAPLDKWAVQRALHGETIANAEYWIHRKDTGATWLGSYSFSPIRDVEGAIAGSVVVCRDITASKKAAERLVYQRNHDYLTDLYNRRFLEHELKRLEAEQYLPVTIVIADTNGLKLVNDSFGQAAGDKVLKSAAELLTTGSRPKDIIARYGGDEFVLLLPNTDEADTLKLIREMESKAKQVEIDSYFLSLSFGYHTRQSMQDDFATVFKKAEDMMDRNKLYESSSVKNKTIGLVINSLFAKSNRESQHSKRVSELCEFIALKMGLPFQEVNRMRIAGLMHDIGKIGVSENVLNKPDKLNAQEWEEMKRHPEAGYRILATASEFSDISKFILEHHEHWDGKGYPRGLSGEQISVQARIIMIADAYDAMTSVRSYKQSLSMDEAIAEIKRCSGTHFDPEIAKIFIQSIQEFNLVPGTNLTAL